MLLEVKGIRSQGILFPLLSFQQGFFEVEFDACRVTGHSRDLLALQRDDDASSGDEFIDQALFLAADRGLRPERGRGSHKTLTR